jgi:deoxyribonuclease V
LTTYGDIAAALGNRIAARWVAEYLLRHDHSAHCSCHRVIRANGEPGGYIDGGPTAKLRRLEAEGHRAIADRLPLARVGFQPLNAGTTSGGPLHDLLAWQTKVRDTVEISAPEKEPDFVGGVDICYRDPQRAIAAFALVERESAALVWSTTVEQRVRFPYITSYLTFRELPALLTLIDAVRQAGRLPDVVMVDGSGRLHPVRAGLACSLGVVAKIATVAVAKKRLCGQMVRPDLAPGESCDVLLEGDVVGTAMLDSRGSRKPLFVSPGHRTDVAFATRLARQMLRQHRLPEPLFHADRIGKERS